MELCNRAQISYMQISHALHYMERHRNKQNITVAMMSWELNKKADILQTTDSNAFFVDENIGTSNEISRQFFLYNG